MEKLELKKKNLETLKNNYYLNFIPESILEELATEAANKGLNIYVYAPGRSAKWGLSTELTVIATKEERKDRTKDWTGKPMYKEYLTLIHMPRAYVARTPRGALWREVLGAIEIIKSIDEN